MSGSGRPRRAAAEGVNYKEPGDYPDLSDLEDSLRESSGESVLFSSILGDFSDFEESVLLESTVVDQSEVQVSVSVDDGSVYIGEPLCGSSPRSVISADPVYLLACQTQKPNQLLNWCSVQIRP